LRSDVFEAIPPLCQKTSAIINEVFSSPDTVMTKLVLNIYQGKLQVVPHLNLCSKLVFYLHKVHISNTLRAFCSSSVPMMRGIIKFWF